MRPLTILLAATALLASQPALADELIKGKVAKESHDKNDTYAHKMEVGSLLFFNGDVDRAIRAFQRAAELNPKAIDPHKSLINLYAQKGGAEGIANAEHECLEALKIKPNDKDLHFLYGTLLKNEASSITDKDKMVAKCDEAMKELKEAEEGGANPALCEAQIALLSLQKGEFDDALKHIDAAIDKQSVNADAHMIRAVLLFRRIGGDKVNDPAMKDKLQEVFNELDTSIKQKEKNPEAHNTKAQILVAGNKLEEALPEYEATVKAEPKMQQAWLELANLCVTLAEKADTAADKKKAYFEKARDAIEHAKKLKPDDRSIIYASGVIYEKAAATKSTNDEKIDMLRHALDEFTTGVQSETDATLAQQIGGHIQQLRQILGIQTPTAFGPGALFQQQIPGMNAPAIGANGQANIFSHTEPSLLNQSFGNMIKLDTGSTTK